MKRLLILLLMIAGAASAHHGYAAFDTTATVTLHGIVTDFHFVNPHCVVEVDVKDDHDKIQNWKGELSSSSHLAPRGWNAASLEAGDKITITGYRAKNGAPSLWVTKIVLPDGRELKLDGGN
jgi:hypothetical protein